MKFSLLKTAVACAAAVVVSPQLAFAQSTWNVANGSFDNPNNWNPNGVPSSTSDNVIINNGGTSTYNIPGAYSIGEMRVDSGEFVFQGGDLFADGGINPGTSGSGTGKITVNGGRFTTDGSSIIAGSSGTGIFTVNGGYVESGDDFGFGTGSTGVGTFNFNGGEVRGGFAFFGGFGIGTWNQTGGLFRQNFGDIEIGNGGGAGSEGEPGPREGYFNLSGGVVQGSGHLAMGNRYGTGAAVISGGALTVKNDIFVGRGYQFDGYPVGFGGPTSLRVIGDDATIIADGNFTMRNNDIALTSTLIAEITGSTHTTIKVSGDADISRGILKVDLTGYSPVSGNSWTILQAGADLTADKTAIDAIVATGGFDPLTHSEPGFVGTLIGPFASVDYSLAPLTPGLSWNVSYASNSVTLSVTGTALFTADFNQNGQVNGADLTKWKADFGVNGNSDANGDGKSDGADFLIWQQQFGSGVPASAAIGAVPEPASIALIGLAATAMAACSRSRRNQA